MIYCHTTSPLLPHQQYLRPERICREHSLRRQSLRMLKTVCNSEAHPCLAAGPWLQGRVAFPLPLTAAAPGSLPLPSFLPRWGLQLLGEESSPPMAGRARPASSVLGAECQSRLIRKGLWYQGVSVRTC